MALPLEAYAFYLPREVASRYIDVRLYDAFYRIQAKKFSK